MSEYKLDRLDTNDFDPSGEEHPDDCMCPCCDQPSDEEE